MFVKWMYCKGGKWCTFNRVPLDDPHFDDLYGVFLVWNELRKKKNVIYVGKGKLREKIKANRQSHAIQENILKNTLYVTWASVPEEDVNAAHIYLTKKYDPSIPCPIDGNVYKPVNLPF
ncbi:MAG: hypothetical protein GF419_05710 [Ignavibacteriales bacterium]|nr:hypothetical protein [Ignavibacteriales bacterium]